MRIALAGMLILCGCGSLGKQLGGGSDSQVVDLGTVNIDQPGDSSFSGEADIDIPDGTNGANLVVELTDSDDLVFISRLTRGGTVIRDYFQNPLLPERGEPLEDVTSLMYPTAREVPFGTGSHHVVVTANESHQGAKLIGIFRSGGSTDSGSLSVTVHLAGVPGIDASSAADHPKMKTFLAEYERLLAKAQIGLGAVDYVDVTDDSLFDMQGPSSAPGTPLAQLFQLSSSTPGRHLNLFITRTLSQEGATPLLGISGGVPGPGEIEGTIHSGVVASGEDLLQDVPAGADDRNVGPKLVAQVAAHETLHYLGLNHTSETDCSTQPDHDPITDTPECSACPLSASACAGRDASNLMFPSGVEYDKLPAGTDATVTPGQAYVAVRNPLVE